MFGWGKTLDVITLFHKPSLPASMRMLALLQQASTKAGDPAQRVNIKRGDWQLDVIENQPTHDQVRSILEYVGAQRAGQVIRGAKDESDALDRFKEKPDDLVWPMTVDWSNGQVVVGPNEPEVMKMLEWNGK